MPTSNVIRQLPIEFPHRPSLDKEDFLVAECNIEAVEMIDTLYETLKTALK